ncbi:D-glycero-D-manno-heptose 1,7-bisphosphate phosphatase [Catalinimonas alkaloidigena]|uniref:D-glycero-alpha-D-manno-heptose-1,7-bisphosphate 7-phosphatase n=1 Tax=Catalinimonas alkaloidigena TaxID=1075417 RepID=UPI002404C604|nr:HAD family hydrolase [Catalinimonas alkaloidigena]MDF9800386.1 D-glycero-D-manno-heptose 1,7-bisphosphate phosphatase [Catalinimonas alkaloidigena]
MTKCIFLDRDGVINRDRVDYAYDLSHFEILAGVPQALVKLKKAGYLLVVVTNQSGIAKDIYTREDMRACHQYMHEQTDHVIDAVYYAPHHPSVTESLTRKPDTLMFEKAIARFGIDPGKSWMIGDKERDIIPARQFDIPSILIGPSKEETLAQYIVEDLAEATEIILGKL